MSNEKLRKFQQSIFNIRSLFLFPAWVLSLVVLLSVPATKTIFLWDFVVLGEAKALVVKVGQIDAGFRFGLFGYCFDGLDAKLLGIGGDIIHASCVKTSIGIHIDPKVANPLGLDHLENDLNNSFRAVIAFHVITFVAVTLAFIFNLLPRSVARSSLNDIKNNPRLAMGYANKLTFPFICLITAAAFVSFIIDIAVAKAAQGLLEAGTINVPIGDIHFDAHTGPIPWIMLTVFLLLLILLVNEKTDFIGKCIPSLSVKKPEVPHQDKVPMSEVDREAARPGASSHGEQWSQVQLDERQRSQDGNPYTQHY